MREKDKKAILTKAINKLFRGTVIRKIKNPDPKGEWTSITIVPSTFILIANFNTAHGHLLEKLTVPKFTDYIVRNGLFEKFRKCITDTPAENTDN